MSKVNFWINITASKLFAYYALTIGTAMAFIYDDTSVFIQTLAISTGLFGAKMGKDFLNKKIDHAKK